MKSVLLVTAGIFHPPYFARRALHKGLTRMEGFTFQRSQSLEHLPEDFHSLSAMVLYFHAKAISVLALKRLDAFIENGGGILALHSATASFKQEGQYFEILGGRFTSHGQVKEYEIRRVKDGIFGGVESFVVRDELYIHELQPGTEVHFTAGKPGLGVPAVWTYRYGGGKVCYCMLGHTTSSMKHPAVQDIIQRGLEWVVE